MRTYEAVPPQPSLMFDRRQQHPGCRRPRFRGDAGDLLTDVLSPERIRRRGWFRPEAVAELVSAHRAGHAKFSNRLYALFSLELWAQEYLS